MKAAGAYLRALRERLGISQAELARRINVSSSQVHRIEEGPGETRPSLVASAAIAVGANPEHLIKLLADPQANEATGIDMARQWINAANNEQQLSHSALRPEVISLAQKMSEFQLGRWVAAGERILED